MDASHSWADLREDTGVCEIEAAGPYKFTGFGAIDVSKPYKFIWFGDIDDPKAYELLGPSSFYLGDLMPTWQNIVERSLHTTIY